MNKKIIFSLALLICTFQLNSQTVQTQWIQEFESKFEGVDVLLIEDDFIFLFLKKSYDEYVIQKRRLSDNSLEKEIVFEGVEHNGKLIKQFFREGSFIRKDTGIYFFDSYTSKKGKIGFISLFKLNKTSLTFEELQKIEVPLSKKNEKIGISYFLTQVNNEEVIILSSSTSIENNIIDMEFLKHNYFIVNQNSIKEIKKSEYISLENLHEINTPKLKVTPGYTFEYSKYLNDISRRKISCNNQEYFERAFFPNLFITNNFFTIVNTNNIKDNNIKEEEFFLLNFNSNYDSLVSNTEIKTIEGSYDALKAKSVLDCEINSNFSFNINKDDDLSYFKLGVNNYFVGVSNEKITYSSEPNSISSTSNATYTTKMFSKDIHIACLSSKGEYLWDKSIIRDKYRVNESISDRSYYVKEFNNKIIIFYSSEYLIIDVSTGENSIQTSNFQLNALYKLGENSQMLDYSDKFIKYEDKTVVISYEGKGNKKTIKIGYLNIVE